jgi:4-oxalocrotonate tautomerase
VKVLEGIFSSTQKREIVRKLTDTMVSIEGKNLRLLTQTGDG